MKESGTQLTISFNGQFVATRDIRMCLPCKKLSPRYIDPFSIVKQISPFTYQLQLPPEYRIHPTFHVSLSVLPTEPGPTEEAPLH